MVDNAVLGVLEIGLEEGKDLDVDVDLEELACHHQLQILRSDGTPYPEPQISLHSGESSLLLGDVFSGDPQGRVDLHATPAGEYLLRILESGKCIYSREIALSGRAGTTVVRIDSSAAIRAQLTLSGVPLVGYQLELYRADTPLPIDTRAGDAMGRVVFEGLWPGTYELFVTAPKVFMGPYRLEATVGADEQHLHCRGLGSLEITGGPARQELAFDLRCLESGSRLSEWMERGTLQVQDLHLDEQGKLSLPVLPEGEYSWELSNGENGQIQVPAGTQTLLELQVD